MQKQFWRTMGMLLGVGYTTWVTPVFADMIVGRGPTEDVLACENKKIGDACEMAAGPGRCLWVQPWPYKPGVLACVPSKDEKKFRELNVIVDAPESAPVGDNQNKPVQQPSTEEVATGCGSKKHFAVNPPLLVYSVMFFLFAGLLLRRKNTSVFRG